MSAKTGKWHRQVAVAPNLFDRMTLRWGSFPCAREEGPSVPREVSAEASSFVRALPSGPARGVLERTADALRSAHDAGRAVVLAVGANVYQAGAAPFLLEFIERGLVTCLCFDGDAARYDVENGLFGYTLGPMQQHGVEAGLWEETGVLWAEALRRGRGRRLGIGRALGDLLNERSSRFAAESLIAACARKGIPGSVHFAMGSLGLELHPDISGADLGEAAMIDFRAFLQEAMKLDGGAWIHAAEFMPQGRLLCRAHAMMNNLGMAPETIACTFLGLEPRRAYNQELRFVLPEETRPGQIIEFLPGALDVVLPLLRVAVFGPGCRPDVFRDL